MDTVSAEIWSFFAQYGLGGGLGAIFMGLYLYERKSRSDDRKEADRKLQDAHSENIESLKLIIPLVQKLTLTMDTVLPLLMRNIDRRQG